MQSYPQKEKRKQSKKGKYCTFSGKVASIKIGDIVPKKIRCPECNRQLEPTWNDCGCGRYHFCYGWLTIKKHRRNK